MPAPIGQPKGFIRTSVPLLADPSGTYLQNELSAIQASIATLLIFSPSAATKPPTALGDGMIRLSRAPWRPLAGQTADTWVYYDAPSGSWMALNP
jgi:hypothetical protein